MSRGPGGPPATGAQIETALEAAGDPRPDPARRLTWLRLGGLGLFVVLVLVIGYQAGWREHLKAEALRQTVEAAGGWGFIIFVMAFLVGQVLYVPGMVFVGVAVFAWGPFAGFALGYGCGLLGVNVHFALLRWIGGSPLAADALGKRWKWVQRILDDLERHPIRSVAILRLLAFMSPPLNTGLALTGLKARDHLIGSALGLVLPVAFAAGLFNWLLA